MKIRRCSCGMDLLKGGFFTYGWIETKFVNEGIQFELSDYHIDCCTVFFCSHCRGQINWNISEVLAPYYDNLEKRINDMTINTKGLLKPKHKYNCSSCLDNRKSYYTSYRITFSNLSINNCSRVEIERDDPFIREVVEVDVEALKKRAIEKDLPWFDGMKLPTQRVITGLNIGKAPKQVEEYRCTVCNEPIKRQKKIKDKIKMLENELNKQYKTI